MQTEDQEIIVEHENEIWVVRRGPSVLSVFTDKTQAEKFIDNLEQGEKQCGLLPKTADC